MQLSELDLKPPKSLLKSTTIARSKFVRAVSSAIAVIDAVGIALILTVLPPESRDVAELVITVITILGMVLNIDKANKINAERKTRGDLFGPDDGIADKAEEALYWIGANAEQFEAIKKALGQI